MRTLSYERLVAGATEAGAEIGGLVEAAPAGTVRSCPDWSGSDLLAHVTGFALWVTELLTGTTEPTGPPPAPEPTGTRREWEGALARLGTVLRGTDPERPAWNWSTHPNTASFWLRRCAHELAVHRWDAATLTGEPAPVPAEQARDGIEEYFDVFVTTALDTGSVAPAEETIILEPWDGRDAITRDLPHPGPVTRLRGSTSDLFLGLWHRVPPVRLFVDGDRALVENWPHV
ncbi:maleylpyruvate isomerase family mycothiol-dependent enzyme [Actinopolyspora mortivallis]|uniref:maleylpyruvate isomerase family mycothiol-dependent enzyme n=1 Tax=Actinopolyspora mortivallis TaxID=33906 RepID=UPI000375A37A|nr:maleylpyruvate isomerase family mycothiol-dependent enzyme [Actinopolyspora mortivallis]